MELKCPQCGKWMAVSQEELVMHDCQVVCPQCLAVCSYENGALVVRDDSDAPYRHTVNVETPKQENSRFCHSCGKQIPSGIRFCPYCGVDLKAPFDSTQQQASTPQQPEPAPKPVEQPKPVEEKPVRQPSRRKSSDQVEDNLRTITHHYSTMRPHLHQNGTAPSRAFKIVAYAIILILLIVFICFIVAGLNIDPAI